MFCGSRWGGIRFRYCREVFAKIKDLKTPKCPFATLLEGSEGRWGQSLSAEKRRRAAFG